MMKRKVYALGLFDSVHIGHRDLIREGKILAEKLDADFCLVTFGDDLYSSLGRNDKEIFLLNERLEVLKEAEVDEVSVLPSDKSFMEKTAEEFLQYLEGFDPAAIIVGEDYRFGAKATGNVELLKQYFINKDVPVKVCKLVSCDGEKVATSRIKFYLQNAEIEKANFLLTRPYFMTGKVINGLKNGCKMGLPTANIAIDERKFIPKNGVYVTKTVIDGAVYPSVSNLGTHPTINTNIANLETFILDFDKDIYDKTIKIEFYKWIRDIKKFSSLTELAEQIKSDINFARQVLKL